MTADVMIRVRADTGDAEQKLGGLRGTISRLPDVVRGAGVALAGLATAAIGVGAAAVTGIGSLAIEAAKAENTKLTFNNLATSIGTTSDSLLDKLVPATRGMVSELDLMEASNKFVAMGLATTEDEAAALAEMATQLGIAMGEDATGSMENFALMLANQSIPRLDSFGISSGTVRDRINELMESTQGMTREQAFMQAVMEQGRLTMEKVGEQGGTTGAKMEAMRANFENAKMTIGEAFLPILDTLVTAFSGLVEEWAPKIADFALNLAGWFQGAVEAIGPFVESVIEWFQNVIPGVWSFFTGSTSGMTTEVSALWTTLRDVIMAVVDRVVSWVQENWPKIQEIFETVGAIIMEIVNTVWPQIKETIQSIIDTIIKWVQANWPLIQETVETVLKAIQNVIETVLTAIKKFWDDHGQKIIGIVENVWNFISGIIEAVMTAIMGIIKAIMQAITGDWEGAWNTIKATAEDVWDKIKEAISSAWEAIKDYFEIGLSLIGSLWEKAWTAIKETAASIWEAIKKLIGDAWAGLQNLFQQGVGRLQQVWRAGWDKLREIARTILTAIADTIKNAMDRIAGIFRSVVDKIKNAFSNVNWGSVGQAITSGIANAIRAGASAVLNAAKEVARAALQAIKNALGIGSPSRLFAEVGRNMMEGMSAGIQASAGLPITSTVQTARGMYRAAATATTNYNLTIHTSAPAESAISDFHVMRALAGV